jgi:hypothetical protein
MDTLNNLLRRLHESLHKDEILKLKVVTAIENRTKITLPTDKITIKEGVLLISGSPVINTEISFKEEEIKNTLKSEGVVVSRILYR